MSPNTLSKYLPARTLALGAFVFAAALALYAPLPMQIAFMGAMLSLLVGLTLSQYQQGQRQNGHQTSDDLLQTTFRLAADKDISQSYHAVGATLLNAGQFHDPIYRAETLRRLGQLAEELRPIGEGRIHFEDGQRWRLAYEELLRSPGLHTYRSVSVVDSEAYWQNEPGRRSMQLNFELQARGTLTIERVIVIDDHFWPANQHLPSEPLLSWIDEQHRHGIWLMLARSSSVITEPDLHVDFGIYGNRAVGTEEVDSRSRMPRFCLSFDFADVRKAEDRWERLQAYCVSYRDLLDRPDLRC